MDHVTVATRGMLSMNNYNKTFFNEQYKGKKKEIKYAKTIL